MAQSYTFDKSTVGLETVNGEVRFHCIATLLDDGVPIARRLIQGCVDFADLKAKAAALFDGEVSPDPVPVDEEAKLTAIKASIDDKPIAKKLAVQ